MTVNIMGAQAFEVTEKPLALAKMNWKLLAAESLLRTRLDAWEQQTTWRVPWFIKRSM